MGPECEGVRGKWGRSVNGSARSGAGDCLGQLHMVQNFEGFSRKWVRDVKGSV